jgi:peroxiredoxin family protein
MLPKGADKLSLSKMNMLGMGTAMMKSVMRSQNVLSLPELIRSAREAGARFIACDMAMDVMGLKREELLEVDEVAGVATFAALAKESGRVLFI